MAKEINQTSVQSTIVVVPLDELRDIIRQSIREEVKTTIPTSAPSDVFIKENEVLDLLRISSVTLYKWRKKGIIPYHRIASRIYFKKDEVLAAIDELRKFKTRK